MLMADVATRRAPRLARLAAPAPPARARLLAKARRNTAAWGFLIGAVLCFTFFSWFPIVREVIMSFQKPVYGAAHLRRLLELHPDHP